MSKADKLFRELGYGKTKNDIDLVIYSKYFEITECTLDIAFVIDEKRYELPIDKHLVIDIDIPLHSAIHEKMKELGLIE